MKTRKDMARPSGMVRRGAFVCCMVLVGLGLAGSGQAQVIPVTLGGVKQLTYQGAIARLSAGDSEIVEISPLGTTDVLIKGRSIGTTSLMVWGREGGQASYTIQVGLDSELLAANLKELFPGEQVTVQSVGETLLLRGMVSSTEIMTAITTWAEEVRTGLGKDATRLKIINRLQLASPQQVQLEVRFAEVSRSAGRKLGVNLLGKWDHTTGNANSGHRYGILGPLSDHVSPSQTNMDPLTTLLDEPIGGAMKLLFISKPDSQFPFNAVVSVLSAHRMAKTLSEPTLVALNGQQSSLLVGGEYPVPIPGIQGQVSIEYKKFGIQLDFVPFVLQDQTIQLKITSTISELDWTIGVMIAGATVPGLKSRTSSNTIRLRSGQGFAVAGLLSDRTSNTVQKVPLLGDIPILGTMFRTTESLREENELVVVVTARLIQPTTPSDLAPLPGEDDVGDPNDFDFFLMGWGETSPKRGSQARPAGRVGYRR